MLKYIFLLAATTFLIVITYFSFREGDSLPTNVFSFADKILHFIAYTIFVLLWTKYLSLSTTKLSLNKILAIVVVLLTVYGILIEVLQSKLTITRMSEGADLVANLLGTIFGVIVYIFLSKKYVKI